MAFALIIAHNSNKKYPLDDSRKRLSVGALSLVIFPHCKDRITGQVCCKHCSYAENTSGQLTWHVSFSYKINFASNYEDSKVMLGLKSKSTPTHIGSSPPYSLWPAAERSGPRAWLKEMPPTNNSRRGPRSSVRWCRPTYSAVRHLGSIPLGGPLKPAQSALTLSQHLSLT